MLWVEKREGAGFREHVKIAATSLTCALLAFGPIMLLWQHPESRVIEVVVAAAVSFILYVVIAIFTMRDEMKALQRGLSQRVGYPPAIET
jgi:hypothetical protein